MTLAADAVVEADEAVGGEAGAEVNSLERLDMPDAPTTLGGVFRTFFRYGSPWILTLGALGAIAARLLLGAASWSVWDAVIAGGLVLLWPLNEWLIHVFVLHFRPFELGGRRVDPSLARKHRAHHADPWQADLVFIPPGAALMAAPILTALWLGLAPNILLGLTGLATYFVLSWHYEWVHLLVHTRYRPRSWFYKRLWRHHRLHHFKNEHFWFGVSMTSGDGLLRTRPDFREVETSPTCRTLGIDAERCAR